MLNQTTRESGKTSENLTASLLRLHTLNTLPFQSFLECLIDNNLLGLIISGECDDIFLQEYWESLYLQFVDATAIEGNTSMTAEAQYYNYDIQIKRIQLLIDAAKVSYQPDILQLLRDDDFNLPFTEESYLDDLNIVVAHCQRYVMLRNQYKSQINEAKGNNEGEKLGYEYFAGVMNAISKMEGYNVPETITTMRFCRYYVQLLNMIERKQMQQE